MRREHQLIFWIAYRWYRLIIRFVYLFGFSRGKRGIKTMDYRLERLYQYAIHRIYDHNDYRYGSSYLAEYFMALRRRKAGLKV